MGNLGSQPGHANQTLINDDQQWAHSFPRTQPRFNQPKVLPERDARQKLRQTNNGEILQSGGTLTGRYQTDRLSLGRDDRHIRNSSAKTYLPHRIDPSHKYKHLPNNYDKDQMKRFGSEPNLMHLPYNHQTVSDDQEMKKRMKAKKKYRAPLPPKSPLLVNSLDWDENSSAENIPIRKARMFKTRAETKKYQSSPVYNNHSNILEKSDNHQKSTNNNNNNNINDNKLSYETNDTSIQMRDRNKNILLSNNRLSLPEITKTNLEFHEELKEATKRLKTSKIDLNTNAISNNNKVEKEKLKTLDHNISKKDNVRLKLKQIVEAEEKKKLIIPTAVECVRGEGSGKESSSPEQSTPRITREAKNPKEVSKTFYFGMGEEPLLENNVVEFHDDKDIVDHFASNLHSLSHILVPEHSSESDMSSEIEIDETQMILRTGIDLQLRPILPKKQLEIPRFSPAAAWRLLSAVDSNAVASTIASDDPPVFIEDRIEKYSRPPPPAIQMGPRSSNDKSGDSGISGDAGPVGYDDHPDVIMNSRNTLQLTPQPSRNQGQSWTPQQDLGDDSSMEDGANNELSNYKLKPQRNRPHVFSLSLPRDNQLASYASDNYSPTYSGLQKLKRSVSGVFGNLSTRKELAQQQSNVLQDQGDNWFLSKSAPNSLNNGLNSLEVKHSQKSDDTDRQLLTNSSVKQNSGRVMYLPELNYEQNQARAKSKHETRVRSKSAERSNNNYKLSVYSKSCENIVAEVASTQEPKNLQDPPVVSSQPTHRKRKRFTFQSTVRQIERRKLAEKLSKEAEKKERQRLRELEAMQKVEEEFQKKRAREKASIRQQLRLYSMDDTSWSSLPPNLDLKDEMPTRAEPDGAASSSTPSPSLPLQKTPESSKKVYQKNKKMPENASTKHRPSSESSDDLKLKTQVTQVLSEYRHPRREYKEYRGSIRYLAETNDTHHSKQTTVHPQVTCNMPKAKGQSSTTTKGTNYRKDFAHGGVKSSMSAGSTYSEESQSRNNSPRMYHNKYTPLTRF